MLLYLYMVW